MLTTWLNHDEWQVSYQGEWHPYAELLRILDELGDNGWELVGIDGNIGSVKPHFSNAGLAYTDGRYFFFKRPKPPVPSELTKPLQDAGAMLKEASGPEFQWSNDAP